MDAGVADLEGSLVKVGAAPQWGVSRHNGAAVAIACHRGHACQTCFHGLSFTLAIGPLLCGGLLALCGFFWFTDLEPILEHGHIAQTSAVAADSEQNHSQNHHSCVDTLAAMMNVTFELDQFGGRILLSRSFSSSIYAVDGWRALKVHKGSTCPEAVLVDNLPSDQTVVHVLRTSDVQCSDERRTRFTGILMHRIDGTDLTVYGLSRPRATNEQGLRIAADLAVALHILHTKLTGYVALHCNIIPKNVIISQDREGNPDHAVLLDYGLAMVHKLQPGETLANKIFPRRPMFDHCRGTNWENLSGGEVAFNAFIEWRELGILLWRLVESGNSADDDGGQIFSGMTPTCDFKCAATRNLDDARHLRGPLLNLTRFLILEHDQIRDEAVEVLGHHAFMGLAESPQSRAQRTQPVTVSREFAKTFAAAPDSEQSHRHQDHRCLNALAATMNITFELDLFGQRIILGKGSAGTVYAVNDWRALKVQQGSTLPEAILGANLPHDPTVVRVLRTSEIQCNTLWPRMYSGMLMRRVNGTMSSPYELSKPHLTNDQGLHIAADLAVALHIFHTKLTGYIVLHCDILPKNVIVTQDHRRGNFKYAVLLDYGHALVHKLRPGETLAKKMFYRMSGGRHCRGTNWQDISRGKVPFNTFVEWRELGILLWRLVEGGNGNDDANGPIFSGRSRFCNFKCAARRNLDNAKQLAGPLLQLVRFLILGHEKIRDEAAEVLGHHSFIGLAESPRGRAQKIPLVNVSTEFAKIFDGVTSLHSDEILASVTDR